MKVLLVGCGAVGLSIASALYTSKASVDLIARGQTAQAVRTYGIERCGILGRAIVPAEKVCVIEKIGDAAGNYDFIVNSAKATGNADIAEDLAKRKTDILGPEGRLVICQNGYGNEQPFTNIFDLEQIYHASFAIGFRRPEPHISEATVITSPFSIGSIFGYPSDRCKELSDAIDHGGIPCGLTEEIDKTLWAKLLYNCTLNPLSAILGINYGGLIKSESSVALMKGIIHEVFAVMRASGHDTFWSDAESYIKDFFDRILPPTYGHRSSTLQDIERKNPTEIGSLNGAIVKIGAQFNVDVPLNRAITQIIRSKEDLYFET